MCSFTFFDKVQSDHAPEVENCKVVSESTWAFSLDH